MVDHGIEIPAPIGDDISHNVDKDLHMDDYIKLSPTIDHEAISSLKHEHNIVLLQVDTAVAGLQDVLFAPQSIFSDENLISDDYRIDPMSSTSPYEATNCFSKQQHVHVFQTKPDYLDPLH